MTGNFNIRDSNWNPSYPFHSIHSDLFVDIANAFDFHFHILLTLFLPDIQITETI